MMNMMSASGALAMEENSPTTDSRDLSRIGDMAQAYGITLRALRFYEDKGLLAPVREGSTRLYTRRDRARLKLILLGRRVGFSLREVKQLIDLYDPAGNNVKQLRVALDKGTRQMSKLENERAEIDASIQELDVLISDIKSRLTPKEQTPAGN